MTLRLIRSKGESQTAAPMTSAVDKIVQSAQAKKMPTEKDYIDARLETIETRMDARIASIENKMDAKFSAMTSEIHRSTAETVKWVSGIVATSLALAITIMTFVINNASPKPAASPVPIVIQVPPAAQAATNPLPDNYFKKNPPK